MIKETYNKIANWLSDKDSSKIKLIREQFIFNNTKIKDFQYTMNWLDNIHEMDDMCKTLIFGETIISINDIKRVLLSKINNHRDDIISEQEELFSEMNNEEIKEYKDNESHGYYDEDGYATLNLLNDILDLYDTLDDDLLICINNNSVIDNYDIDIEGERSQLLRNTNINLLILNYFLYTIKNVEEIKENNRYYPSDVFLPTIEELNLFYETIYLDKYSRMFESYNYDIKNMIDKYGNEPMFLEQINKIKELIVDEEYIKNKLK